MNYPNGLCNVKYSSLLSCVKAYVLFVWNSYSNTILLKNVHFWGEPSYIQKKQKTKKRTANRITFQCPQIILHSAHALPPDLRARTEPYSSAGCEVMRQTKQKSWSFKIRFETFSFKPTVNCKVSLQWCKSLPLFVFFF